MRHYIIFETKNSEKIKKIQKEYLNLDLLISYKKLASQISDISYDFAPKLQHSLQNINIYEEGKCRKWEVI